MNIKPILIATVVALTSINAYARCVCAGRQVSESVFTAEQVAYSAANSVPAGQHAVSYNCELKTMYGQHLALQTVLAGDSYAPFPLSDGTESCDSTKTLYVVGCTVASSEYNTFSVSYNNGGGSGSAPSTPTNCTYNGTCNAPANTFNAPVAKVFQNWVCTKSNGTGCGTFLPGQSISTATTTDNDTITLTAQWGDNLATIATSKSYVDSKMNALQPNFSGLGANKLMTYGTTAGAVGSRDIVTTLGDSKTANTIPTRGAINTVLNTKQPTMNGTAGYVVTNTGTAGMLGEKPIYGTTNKSSRALVEAGTLNAAVIKAVNSELIQVDAGWQINTVDNLALLPIREYVCGSGNDVCQRAIDGSGDDGDDDCWGDVMNILGPTNSRSGMFSSPYYDADESAQVYGKSVCSSISGSPSQISTNQQNTTMDNEFTAQAGNGNLSSDQKYCWCKFAGVVRDNGTGYSVNDSLWVRVYDPYDDYPMSTSSECANWCAEVCGKGIQYCYRAFLEPFYYGTLDE